MENILQKIILKKNEENEIKNFEGKNLIQKDCRVIFNIGRVFDGPGKTLAIRRTPIRGNSVSRHHGGPIDGSLETHRIIQHYGIKGYKRALNCAPTMPREASLPDSKCQFYFPRVSLLS